MKKWHVWLLPLSGVLTALCLLFPQIGLLEWVTLAPALYALFAAEEHGARRFYARGLLCFFSFYLAIYHWFVSLYPMTFLGFTPAQAVGLIALCWVGLAALQTVFSALVFLFYALLARTAPAARYPILKPLLFAALYTVFEWAQTLTWAGVPWARLPLGQIKSGFLANSAALFGSYFLTFALVTVNALLAYALLHLDRARFVALLALAAFALNAGAGAVGYLTAKTGDGAALTAAAVQGNVGSGDKWDTSAEMVRASYDIYDRYTHAAAEMGASMVVFPETFIPAELSETSSLGRYIRDLAVTYGVTVRAGAFYHEGEARYNAVFTVYPDGTIDKTVYAKRRLVPFGEFVPWRPFVSAIFPGLAEMNMLEEDLAAGEGPAVVEMPEGRVGTLICFDSIYEDLTRDAVRDGAQFITLSTNDSWFTDSAAVYMHSAQAQLRAIESGRWIVRSADTGISSVISPDGKTHDVEPPLVEGMSLDTIHLRDTRTLYMRIGNLFVYLLLGGIAFLAFAPLWTCKKRKPMIK